PRASAAGLAAIVATVSPAAVSAAVLPGGGMGVLARVGGTVVAGAGAVVAAAAALRAAAASAAASGRAARVVSPARPCASSAGSPGARCCGTAVAIWAIVVAAVVAVLGDESVPAGRAAD